MNRRMWVSAALAVMLAVATLQANAEQSRLALVIGNADYATAPLRNPANDARAMSQKLKELNFDVITVLNGTNRQMTTALNEFADKLKRYDVGLFYYSGHGVQYQGANYLVPVDASIHRAVDIQFDALNADQVLLDMSSAGNKVNIMILDACRNNPFISQFRSVSRGLSVVQAPAGSLVVYSTAPNQVASDGKGRNSPFTAALLENISEPGEDIQVMLTNVFQQVQKTTNGKQVPWVSSSLTTSFYFAPEAAGPGILVVDPGIEGIQVSIDGQVVGTTPLTYQADAGLHKISFSDQRIEEYNVSLTVRAGQTVQVAPQLQLRPTVVLPQDLPDGAALTVNGKVITETPGIHYVDPGKYVFAVQGKFIKAVEEKVTLKAGQHYEFNPKIAYRQGSLAFTSLPDYVDVSIDGKTVTKELKEDPETGAKMLNQIQAGPHLISFTGQYVMKKQLSLTVEPDAITTVAPKLDLLGLAHVRVNSPTELQKPYHVVFISPNRSNRTLSGKGSDTFSLTLDPGDYQVNAGFTDDPGTGYVGDLQVEAGKESTLSIPMQYSIQYITVQLQSIRNSTEAQLQQITQRSTARIAKLQAQRDGQNVELGRLEKKRRSKTRGGTFLNLLGLTGAAVAGISYLESLGSVAAYETASGPVMSEEFTMQAQQLHVLFLASAIVGASSFVWGNGLLLSRPSTADLEQSIRELDAQLNVLNSLKEMGL